MYRAKTFEKLWELAPKRFFKKVEKTSRCWLWNGSRNRDGYGVFSIQGKAIKAHVFSYRIHKGDIDFGLEICHTCDNPPCVNPNHLFQATHSENMKDAFRKGRRKTLTFSKLTAAQVAEVKKAHGNCVERKWGAKKLAEKFGVNRETICRIGRGETWQKF